MVKVMERVLIELSRIEIHEDKTFGVRVCAVLIELSRIEIHSGL